MIIHYKNFIINTTSTLFILMVCFLVSIRSGEHFSDVNNYISMYYDVIDKGVANAEMTFALISKFSNYLNLEYLGVFFIYSLISIFSKFYFWSSDIKNKKMILFLYLSTFFILYELVQMRVATALGLFLLFLTFWFERKRFLSILFLIAAVMFHYSIGILLFVFLLFICVCFICNGIFYRSFAVRFFCVATIALSLYMIMSWSVGGIPFLNLSANGFLGGILPERLFKGYVENSELNLVMSSKAMLSAFLACVCSMFLLLGYLDAKPIYIYSALSVLSSIWIYFFLGGAGVVADRLAELCIIFILLFVDGVLVRNFRVGFILYVAVFIIFSFNILFRAQYYVW